MKEEALDRTMCRARFGTRFGPVVRRTTKWMNFYMQNIRQYFEDFLKILSQASQHVFLCRYAFISYRVFLALIISDKAVWLF